MKKDILKSTVVVGFCTSISRIFGYLRDLSLATVLGAGFSMDAFTMAYRLANLLRRLVAEGSLGAAFIPVYTVYKKEHTAEELRDFVARFFNVLLLILVGLVCLGVVGAPWIVRIMAPGFAAVPDKLSLTILLNRMMMPYLLFVSLSALMMAILNANRHFFMPALAPVFFNIAIIFSAYKLAPLFEEPSTGVAIGVLIGGIGQLACQVPFAVRKGLGFTRRFSWNHPAIVKIGKLFLPGVMGVGVNQINIFVASFVASILREGSVSYIYFSNRIVELVLGVFTVSLSIAILPEMSRKAAEGNVDDLKRLFRFAFKMVFLITLPAMVGMILLRGQIIKVLFEHGRFSSVDTGYTAQALLFFSGGLFFMSCSKIMAPVFYAFHNTKVPVKCAMWAMLANCVFNLMFFRALGVGGIALAATLASVVNVVFLSYYCRRFLGKLNILSDWMFYAKVVGSSIIMGLVVFVLHSYTYCFQESFLWEALYCFFVIGLAVLVYVVLLVLFRVRQVGDLFRMVWGKAQM